MHAILLICLLAGSAMASSSVTIKDLRLFVDQNEYYIKGIAYSPSPLAKTIDGQQGGSGLCTPRPAYATGSYSQVIQLSGCNSEDYFDGTVYTPGPAGGWWNGIWERDFPLIASMGANTIRIYHTYPITQAAINANPAYNAGSGVLGSNHIPFMDLAAQYNLKVVFPLYADSATLDTLSDDWIQLYIRYLVDEVGNHPALLMYTFGNELQFWTRDASYAARIDSFVRYARAYQLEKWNRPIPITVALIDYPPYYNSIVEQISFDIITTNAGYRGFDFSNLWSGDASSNFAGMFSLSCSTGKPLLIGEMGVHNTTPVFDVPSWFGRMWSDIINHKNQGAIGGFLFSFQEEHWKGVTPAIDWKTMPDVNMGVITLSPGSGTYPVDIAVKKDYGAYDFDSVTQGFSQNVWAQDGPNTLSSVTNNFCSGAQSTISSPLIGNAVTIGNTVAPTASQSSNSGAGAAAGSGGCGSGLSSCGAACYSATQYCCVGTVLYPAGNAQCSASAPAVASSTTSQNAATPTTAAPSAQSSATSDQAAATSATSQVPATSTANQASSTTGQSSTGVATPATSSQTQQPADSSASTGVAPSSSNNGGSSGSSTASPVVTSSNDNAQGTVDRQQGSGASIAVSLSLMVAAAALAL